ncbi:hypothetical protein JHD48_01005 [Sulfurimonas sp. SAG-AH-194-I05]|nr:hypothetical protein [Sulfurimonas sp. SAG-AH-194-I05]MDF1874306.1 hypothetical protein [Sulfurimonas sp. SAG-AH-194-I05]
MLTKVLFLLLFSSTLLYSNVYETNCVACHEELPVSIDKYFYRYLLQYSSKREVKKAMIKYLNSPSQKRSVMAEAFIRRFGVKAKTTLKHKELRDAIDIYWDKYKVFGTLK